MEKDVVFFQKNNSVYKIFILQLIGDKKYVADTLTTMLKGMEQRFHPMKRVYTEHEFTSLIKNGKIIFFYKFNYKNSQFFIKKDNKLNEVDVEFFYKELLDGF